MLEIIHEPINPVAPATNTLEFENFSMNPDERKLISSKSFSGYDFQVFTALMILEWCRANREKVGNI